MMTQSNEQREYPELLTVFYTKAKSTKQLLDAIQVFGNKKPEDCLFVDLSLGEYRPFECFEQLAVQLEEYAFNPDMNNESTINEDNRVIWSDIGKWIDRETQGDICINFCINEVEALAATIEKNDINIIVIKAPIGGRPFNQTSLITIESFRFIKNINILVIADDKFCPLDNWQEIAPKNKTEASLADLSVGVFSLLPGLLTNQERYFYQQFNKASDLPPLLKIRGGFMIPPELRVEFNTDVKSHLRGLARIAPSNSYLQAYALSQCGLSSYSLISSGWQCFIKGDIDQSLFYLRAATCSDDNELQQKAIDVLQIVLIAAQRYKEAEDNLERYAQISEAATLAGAWGTTLVGNTHSSQTKLAEYAEKAKAEPNIVENLYFVNIFALSLFKKGCYDDALKQELELQRLLENAQPKPWHLAYINQLNIARLYRYNRNYSLANEYFEKGLQINYGVIDQFTGLFHALLRAQIQESTKQKQAAKANWLRCLMIWKDIPNKLAIPWRLFSTLVKTTEVKPFERAMVFEQHLVSKISSDKFMELIQFCSSMAERFDKEPICFNYNGLFFYTSDNSNKKLLTRKFLTNIQCEIDCADLSISSWVTDVDPVLLYPSTFHHCIDRAYRLGINKLLYDGEFYDVEKEVLNSDYVLLMNPAISNLSQLIDQTDSQCAFRRLRNDTTIDGEAMGFLDQLIHGKKERCVDSIDWLIAKTLCKDNLIYLGFN